MWEDQSAMDSTISEKRDPELCKNEGWPQQANAMHQNMSFSVFDCSGSDSCVRFLPWFLCNEGLCPEIVNWINPFFPKLYFVRIFYCSHKNKLETEDMMKSLNKTPIVCACMDRHSNIAKLLSTFLIKFP